MRQKCIIQLQYGSYSERMVVYCDENDEEDHIKAKAWKLVRADFLPMAYKHAEIISRKACE